MSTMVGLRPFLRAALAISPASRSELPDSLANTMVSGSAGSGGAAGCGAADDASTPARKPASQARCVGLAGPTTRLRSSISSSRNGAVFGIGLRTSQQLPLNRSHLIETYSLATQYGWKNKKIALVLSDAAGEIIFYFRDLGERPDYAPRRPLAKAAKE